MRLTLDLIEKCGPSIFTKSVEVDFDKSQLMDKIFEEVKTVLDRQGLLRFIREIVRSEVIREIRRKK